MPAKAKTQKVCACCGRERSVSEFYETYSLLPQFEKRIPFCRSCALNKFILLNNQFNEDACIWILCSEAGIPFIKSLWERAKIEYHKPAPDYDKKTPNPFTFYYGQYYNAYKANEDIPYDGFWESDACFEELAYPEGWNEKQKQNNQNIENDLTLEKETKISIEAQEKNRAKERALKENSFIWGSYPEGMEAYDILNRYFQEYTGGLGEMDINLKNRYRDLCKAEYRKRKADETGDIQEIAKAQDNLTKMLALLKLNNFQETSVDEREKFIDRLAWMIEQTEPAEEEDIQKYRDIAGFEQGFKDIMRSMRNLIANTRDYPDISKEDV